MDKIIKGLFIYSLLAAVFITISGVVTAKTNSDLGFQLIIFPISFYFLYLFIRELFTSLKNKTPFKIPLFGNPKDKKGGLIFALILLLILISVSLFRIINK
jgi:hypothetical protein